MRCQLGEEFQKQLLFAQHQKSGGSQTIAGMNQTEKTDDQDVSEFQENH